MPLEMTNRQIGPSTFAAEYFAEEVRRSLIDLYGQDENDNSSFFAGGYSVRSTLDPNLQLMARAALRAGLVNFDRKQAAGEALLPKSTLLEAIGARNSPMFRLWPISNLGGLALFCKRRKTRP